MAQAHDTYGGGRRESVDTTSGGVSAAERGHFSSYVGLAIAGAILMAMMFLQNAASGVY